MSGSLLLETEQRNTEGGTSKDKKSKFELDDEIQPTRPAPAPKRPAPRRRPRSRFGSSYAVYVPPFRAARQSEPTNALERERRKQMLAWTNLRKRINGVINRVNSSNIRSCAVDLFRVNILRGKGVLCKCLMRAQLASSQFSDVYAALVSVINTRVPEVTELLVCRLIIQLKDGYATRERLPCAASIHFLAQLFNQQLIDELPLLEFVSACLLDPSDGSAELAVIVVRECGHFMSEKTPRAVDGVFARLREVLHDNAVSYRTQVLVDDVMELRRKKFAKAASLRSALDLVDEDDIIQHSLSLQDVESSDAKDYLNKFRFDDAFDDNESKYIAIRDILLGDQATPQEKPVTEEPVEEPAAETPPVSAQRTPPEAKKPSDMTESKLVDFRRLVYLKIMSAASYEECAHKLLTLMRDHGGMESELCNMVIECCSQEKSFLRYYGLLAQRLCMLSKSYMRGFEENFARIYATVHRFDTRKIRNIGTLFASLLASGALSWALMHVVHLVEEETTASSRIFLKILFQEVAKTLGDKELVSAFQENEMPTVLRRDEPKNVRFAINFFSSIGLGYLTDDLREFLKNMPKRAPKSADVRAETAESDDESSLSSSSLSSSSLSSSSGISDREDPPEDPPEPPPKRRRAD